MEDEDFTLIIKNSDIILPDFTLLKTLDNDDIINEYTRNYPELFRQMCIDIPRVDVIIDDIKSYFEDILLYISKHPFLKSEQHIVFFFLSQTCLSIPTRLITQMITKIDENLIVCEPENNRRMIICVTPDTITIDKRLRAVIDKDDTIETMYKFHIGIDADLASRETTIYIRGNKNVEYQ